MWIKTAFLLFFGLSAGGIVSAGVFAFLAIIGVFPRLIGKTKTRDHILLYETVIIIGGAAGNVMNLFAFPLPFGGLTAALLTAFGLSVGVFVGCLIMSLAETLKTLPVISRRIHLATGLQYLVLGIALGKLFGALLYFHAERVPVARFLYFHAEGVPVARFLYFSRGMEP